METKEFTYKKGNEGENLLADVHWRRGSPETKTRRGHPIVLVFHRGGFVLGSKSIIPLPQLSALTKLGFLVVVPNYHLCPQIGVFDGPMTDLRDCLIWAVTELPALLEKEDGVGDDDFKVDARTVITMGHSAGGGHPSPSLPVPITAVLDFYGGKYYSDPSWHSPNPLYVNAPQTWPDDDDDEYINRIYDGPQVSSADHYLGKETPPPTRDAWLTAQLKRGTWLAQVVKDGDFDRVDAAKGFRAEFPPTMFVHGTGNTFTESRISERAHAELKSLGVETELLLVPGVQHMFDMLLKEEDDIFKDYVLRGFKFLAEKAGLQSQE
ncbi:hypothetical protein VTN77DRAFT_1054 [Rasamsonia byssochlamydoides]|uniref:uncharacterized protein n=1 Tax=Rasamsonia byssochlamydoides TaxID=89139 RepID=UPI003742E4F7